MKLFMVKKNINVLNIAIGILVFLVLILMIFLFNRNNTSSISKPQLVIVNEHVEVSKNNSVSLLMYVENVTNPYILWTSSDPNIASVDQNGVVIAHKEGMAIVTAEYRHTDGTKYSDNCIVNVIASSDIPVTGVDFVSENLIISNGVQLKLNSIISPSNASSEEIVYSSSDSDIVSVNKDNGLITTKRVGNASVRVTVDGKYSDVININVVKESGVSEYITLPYQLSFESNAMSLAIGDVNTLNYRVSPSDASNKYLTCESSNPNVVSVSNGAIKALSIGEATITVTSLNDVSAKIDITVVSDKISVADVSLTAYETELQKGETLQLSYKVYPENATNKNVSFSSSNSNVVTVSETGLITAKGSGNANISIVTSDGNHTRTVPITVTSGGGSAKCDDGYGPKPNGVCSGSPSITLNGKNLSNEEKININVGDTIVIKVNLPTNNGQPTLLTRTSASGETGWNEYFSAYSSPSVNRYNCSTAQRVSSYEWVITAKRSTNRYIELSQTAEMQTTQCSFVKPMVSVLIKVN